MATVAYQNAKRNSTVFRRLYTAYSFWTAGDMATHQIPFQDANQMAGFIYHHADMSLYEWHITQQRKGQSSSCIRKHYRWQMRWQYGCFGYPRFTSFCSHCRSWLLRFFPSWRLRQQECVFCCQTQGQPALTNRRTFIARNEGAKCAHRRDYYNPQNETFRHSRTSRLFS